MSGGTGDEEVLDKNVAKKYEVLQKLGKGVRPAACRRRHSLAWGPACGAAGAAGRPFCFFATFFSAAAPWPLRLGALYGGKSQVWRTHCALPPARGQLRPAAGGGGAPTRASC